MEILLHIKIIVSLVRPSVMRLFSSRFSAHFTLQLITLTYQSLYPASSLLTYPRDSAASRKTEETWREGEKTPHLRKINPPSTGTDAIQEDAFPWRIAK